MRLGIVGVGGMGSWLTRLALSKGIEVHGYDKDPERTRGIKGLNPAASLEELLVRVDIILVATPPATTPAVLGHLRMAATRSGWSGGIADISTFKKHVIPILQGYPASISVASLRPLFGPRARRLEAHKVLVVPVPGRENNISTFTRLLDTLGLRWETIDHEAHDRLMGLVIGVPYAIGHALARAAGDLLEKAHMVSGTTFKALYLLLATLGDPEDLVNYILGDPDTRAWIQALAQELGSRAPRKDTSLYEDLYCLVEECLTRG